MTTSPAALLRSIISDAVERRPCTRSGRVRFSVVGLEEERFVVELAAKGSAVRADDERAADCSLWIRADDVARLVAGWNLGGVRCSGDQDLLAALLDMLKPGASPLGVRIRGLDAS
ncbi:MAG: hypothetical protein JXR83_07410 [Deltaproteobacteria bacterium]|nr:hypothetical protein [Deltaproteobacteria bacterium]